MIDLKQKLRDLEMGLETLRQDHAALRQAILRQEGAILALRELVQMEEQASQSTAPASPVEAPQP